MIFNKLKDIDLTSKEGEVLSYLIFHLVERESYRKEKSFSDIEKEILQKVDNLYKIYKRNSKIELLGDLQNFINGNKKDDNISFNFKI